MPIKKKNKSAYPANWETEIRPAILERAKHQCEWCGAKNEQWIWYHPGAADYPEVSHLWTQDVAQASKWYGNISDHETPSDGYMVCLTIAHIHDANPSNCNPDNLAALCQTCHNRHDAKMRAMNIVRRQNAEREAAGQLRLL